ncbi:MAG: chromosomal replication initiator protein DnaA [Desulfovibrionaceae bacterium]|nr:chromosomal replication initiator protein DnaA [Desulfovibrionaceae bacterium]
MDTLWQQICAQLERTLPAGYFQVWVSPLHAKISGNNITLTAPTPFVETWIKERLESSIVQAARDVSGRSDLTLCIESRRSETPQNTLRPMAAPTLPQSVQTACSKAPGRIPNNPSRPRLQGLTPHVTESSSEHDRRTDSSLDQPVAGSHMEQAFLPISVPISRRPIVWKYSFDDFVTGPANRLAYTAAVSMTNNSTVADTLFLSSAPGLGKTHLTQAVGHQLCQNCNHDNPKIEYLTAEEFSSGFVQSLRYKTTEQFKNRFRDLDVLLLEDIQFLQGKEKMQLEVLSAIKCLQEHGGRVVLTSSFAPFELKNVDTTLVSRFCSGFLADLEKPDEDTRRRILMEKAKRSSVVLPSDVADVLASSLKGDIRSMESCISNLALKAKMLGEPVTLAMAREMIAKYVREAPSLDIDTIIRKVCEGFHLTFQQIASKSRRQTFVLARNTIFYLARRHTDLSLQDIGDRFNRRHSTVLKGISSIEREIKKESSVGRQIAGTISLIERQS